MKITNVEQQPIVETPHKVDVRKLYDYENAQVMHITLAPAESLRPHITPVDVFFYILEGAVDVRIGDEEITVNANNLVESPKNIVHCLTNKSNDRARILVVKAPKPTKQSRLL